jgi:hypothetical protein
MELVAVKPVVELKAEAARTAAASNVRPKILLKSESVAADSAMAQT